MFKKFIIILLILRCVLCFDPLSFGSTVAVLGGTVYQLIKDNTFCKFKECCTKNEIPADFKALEKQLETKVYGQHLVLNTVINALRAHWDSTHAQKPLTLSFHGWPGGGKNYVSKIIAEALYTKGTKSNHVHHFIGRNLFTVEEKLEDYQRDLYDWIKSNVSNCPYQLFIFDEVDKMPSNVLNAIKPIIDYHDNLDNVDYRKSVFIFLSNTGANVINKQYMQMWRSGIRREDIKLRDFEKMIAVGAFNEKGGFHHSDTIKNNLIDHYIPFLPMEAAHVKQCILYEFQIRGIFDPSDENIEEVLSYIDWDPDPEKVLSRTGCKRISQKVAYIVQANYRH